MKVQSKNTHQVYRQEAWKYNTTDTTKVLLWLGQFATLNMKWAAIPSDCRLKRSYRHVMCFLAFLKISSACFMLSTYECFACNKLSVSIYKQTHCNMRHCHNFCNTKPSLQHIAILSYCTHYIHQNENCITNTNHPSWSQMPIRYMLLCALINTVLKFVLCSKQKQ